MIRLVFLLLVSFCSLASHGQALRDINYGYMYEPSEPVALYIQPVRSENQWRILYKLEPSDSSHHIEDFLLRWDLRSSLVEKEGTAVKAESITETVVNNSREGEIVLPVEVDPQILVAKVLNNLAKRVWIYYKILQPNYPVDGYLVSGGRVVFTPYVHAGSTITIAGQQRDAIISYYKHEFPAAVPPFSEGMGRVSSALKPDSIYTLPANQPLTLTALGLYLVQRDTTSGNGFSFRVVDDYPRYATVESLSDPLIYLCTKQEFDRIKSAEGNKKAFDKVILSITGDADRARDLMRNYFRRVEWANYYFSSYKEGWKTDRGMIFVLFGLPDELFRFEDREVWSFNNKAVKATFDFVRSSTVFDPDNYVLVRESKLKEIWYSKIDLWRNARF
jgi:GWxTD domain-containing protein